MQVTDDMFYAAMDALGSSGSGWLPPSGNVLRKMLQAALDAVGEVELPVIAKVRVQIDEPAFHASVAEAVQRLHDGLPRDENGRITIATLSGKPTAEAAPTDQAETEAPTKLVDERKPHTLPVTEPRPLATASELHFYLGESRECVARMIAQRDGYDPPMPEPVRHDDGYEPLYDPHAVKAWYDALPQAADE